MQSVLAVFLLSIGMLLISEQALSAEQRTCDSQIGQVFEYRVATKSIEGAPLAIQQTDCKGLFSIGPVADYTFLDFATWSGSCIPFLFEVESIESYVEAMGAGKTSEEIYYIATLCREEKFQFRYFEHKNDAWSEIAPSAFPKDRALENLWDWMGGGIKYTRDTPKHVQDGLKDSDEYFVRARATVKPDVYLFYTGLTARMWAHLESGVDFWAFDEHFTDDEARQHAVAYAEKYSID
ncbi:MAG: hypothetical protein ACR2QT_06680 [Woeseiaceae bacterium]